MVVIVGDHSSLYGYTGPRTNWANEMDFIMNHASSAGSIDRPVDQQSSTLPLSYGFPQQE